MKPLFRELEIKGVWLASLVVHYDERGWLSEVFRDDWFGDQQPVMGYVSETKPGLIRGPHEHQKQFDWFVFLGPSDFLVVLWDNRSDSPSRARRLELNLGEKNPGILIVPPGVVHGYKNIGDRPGWVLNFPNQLYRGWNEAEKVDEIRYEGKPDSPFRME